MKNIIIDGVEYQPVENKNKQNSSGNLKERIDKLENKMGELIKTMEGLVNTQTSGIQDILAREQLKELHRQEQKRFADNENYSELDIFKRFNY